MPSSLQDQLLAAGLISKKDATQANKKKNKQKKQQLKSKKPVVDENKARLEAERAAAAERDRELNRARQEDLHKRELAAQVKQLILSNRITKDGDVDYNFSYQSKVKKISVSQKQFTALEKKLLAIGINGDQFELIPAAVASKIEQRVPDAVLFCENKDVFELSEEEKDWYQDFEIPDDLDW